MQRFLEVYWCIYFLAYPVGVGLLSWHFRGELVGGDQLTRLYLSGAIFSAAAGASAIFAMVVEAGGYAVLLIPARMRQLREEGRKIGLEQGLEQGREQGLKQGIEQGIKQGIEQRDQRRAEAMARFGYEANGVRVLPDTDEVRRFMAGEEVAPPPPPPPPAAPTPPQPPQRYSRLARKRRRE